MSVNPMIQVWATTTEREIQAEPFQRDERFLRGILPLMEIMNRYFDGEVHGLAHVPPRGPILLLLPDPHVISDGLHEALAELDTALQSVAA